VSTTLKRVHGYLAEFDSVKDLYHAAEQVRDQLVTSAGIALAVPDSRHGRSDGQSALETALVCLLRWHHRHHDRFHHADADSDQFLE
jgi:hypothetical protein